MDKSPLKAGARYKGLGRIYCDVCAIGFYHGFYYLVFGVWVFWGRCVCFSLPMVLPWEKPCQVVVAVQGALSAPLVINIMRDFAHVLAIVDFVPCENAQGLKHFRHTTPMLPFCSAGSHQRTNLTSGTTPAMLRLFKTYKPSATQSVTVHVVGFPNVGKSSLINTLKRIKVRHRVHFEPGMVIVPF